ncbi:Crp/Fnr family transcriptional regulator [Streptomyces sp. NPDC046831]|uniref:Crp/Fnr family transcriptional regulator n=1 Tax=Streptomyces sp. NPDC046831 TaxID=3154805 RepID=UPI003408DE3D
MRHETFWQILDDDERKVMERAGRVPRRPYEPGEPLLRQSDRADRAALIISGRCRVLWHGENGRTTYLATRRDGDLVGEMGLLDGGPRNATLLTLTQTYVRWYGREVFEKLLAEYPGILRKVLASVCTRLKESDHHRVVVAGAPARLRLGRLLLRLAEAEGVPGAGGTVIREVTQQDLGNWTGMGREAAGRGIRQLQQLGLLDDAPVRSRIVVTDVDGLRRHAFGPGAADRPF